MRKQQFIKAAIIGLFVSAAFGVFMTRPERSKAANDDILSALANYRSWGRVTKEPFKVVPFTSPDVLNLRANDAIKSEGINFAV